MRASTLVTRRRSSRGDRRVPVAVVKWSPASPELPRCTCALLLLYITNANHYHCVMQMDDAADDAALRRSTSVPVAPRSIPSRELFVDGAREVVIEHGERIYRLRITQAGKLILTA